jgi:hypothetical protein
MKKVIVFKVENVLVKDFNKEESFRRAMAVGVNKLKRSAGVDMVGKELERIEKEKKEWVERREKEFYNNEFERSKFKNGCGEIMKVLEFIKDRMGVEVVFVSKYRKGKVESVLWSNGLRNMEVESCNGDWVSRVIEKRGKRKEDIVMFSNDINDIERGEEWGIKVERLNVEKEGINGFMSKIGLRQSA